MRVLLATSEAVPFIKTGGLGDVTGALIDEYKKMQIEADIILPLYRKIKTSARDFDIRQTGKEITVPLGDRSESGNLWEGRTPQGAKAYFIENDGFYDRDEIYVAPDGDYPDNASRFIFYSRAVLETIKTLGIRADVIHCNDWQTALIPLYLKTIYKDRLSGTATLLTIHNLGYQGTFRQSDLPLTGLGRDMYNINGLEFHGGINFLKGGILFADIITAVSSNYAKEILTVEYGFGLHHVLRKRKDRLYGVINGIDYSAWNPAEDHLIPAKYGKDDLSGKTICKKSLLKTLGLSEDSSPVVGMVTRLSSHKGIDLVAEAADEIIRSGVQVVMLGKGDKIFHEVFSGLRKKYSGRLSVILAFDNRLAHQIYAGADIFLMPSQYEPCGLGQLIALRYGAIPVVRNTGGLADTITEYDSLKGTGTGFLFSGYSSREMLKALEKANKFFNDKPQWLKIQKNAMSLDFSWSRSAKKYLSLYQKALKKIHPVSGRDG